MYLFRRIIVVRLWCSFSQNSFCFHYGNEHAGSVLERANTAVKRCSTYGCDCLSFRWNMARNLIGFSCANCICQHDPNPFWQYVLSRHTPAPAQHALHTLIHSRNFHTRSKSWHIDGSVWNVESQMLSDPGQIGNKTVTCSMQFNQAATKCV